MHDDMEWELHVESTAEQVLLAARQAAAAVGGIALSAEGIIAGYLQHQTKH